MASLIDVDVQPSALSLGPNAPPAQVMVTIHNRTAVVDQFTLSIEGLEDSWYTAPTTPVALFPGAREVVRFTVHPDATARAGGYPFRVVVHSTVDEGSRGEVLVNLTLTANPQFDLDMNPKKVIGRKGRFTLSLRNTGNTSLSLDLQATDDEENCVYQFRPEEVTLEPGRRQSVILTVRPQRSGFVGQRKDYAFQVTAKPAQGMAKSIQGRIVHTPRLQTWRPARTVFKLMVILAAIGVFVSAEGGVSGIQHKAPQWKASFTKATCERMNLFCPAVPTIPGGHGVPQVKSGAHGKTP
ncbi:MAG TPA: hypothetical protein VNL35_18370 [Chloroflexota bacterium]|nr:hypothetical protein [Chloroflexota bacterium]